MDAPFFFLSSNLSQDTIHYPIGGSGAEPIAGAQPLSAQVLHDVFDEWLLYVFWIGNGEFVMTRLVVQLDGLVGKYREAQHALITDDFDAVFSCTFVGYEAP